jgi:hypothetical protein
MSVNRIFEAVSVLYDIRGLEWRFASLSLNRKHPDLIPGHIKNASSRDVTLAEYGLIYLYCIFPQTTVTLTKYGHIISTPDETNITEMDTYITIDTYLPVRRVVEPHNSTCNYPNTRFASWCQFFFLLPDMGTSGNTAIPRAPRWKRHHPHPFDHPHPFEP